MSIATRTSALTRSSPNCRTSIEHYRDQLAGRLGDRFAHAEWEPQLDLALLGRCLRTLGLKVYFAEKGETALLRDTIRADLYWWCEQARKGLSVLSEG